MQRSQLDYFLKQKIENYIDIYLKKHNITLIMVSHNGEETMRWGEKVIFLNNGKIGRIDTPITFYNFPENRKEAGFFGVVNTVFIGGKYLSFRPNTYSLTPNDQFPIKLEIINHKVINKGWYFDHLVKFKKKIIHLYSPDPLEIKKSIFIKSLF